PILFTHKHTFCSYADTIMPQFFFAVVFAFRLTFGRREHEQGLASAYAHTVRRMLGLILVSMVVDQAGPPAHTSQQLVDLGFWGAIRGPLKGGWFSTLTHIAVTSLWILPVIRASAGVRVVYVAFSAALHAALSHWFNFEYVNTGGIDGGNLGFLAWSIP